MSPSVEEMTHEEASLLARKFARMDAEVKALQKEMDHDKGILKQWMGLFEQDELVDAETGLGVKLGKRGRRRTEWDTLSMPDSLVAQLHHLNLLDVRTTAFDKAGTSAAVDEAKRYRIDGETEPPFQVVKGETR